jgi:ABC-type dipeptide/oligopeptide/nickel transport system ATPase component
MSELLEIQDLTVAYGAAKVLDAVSLRIGAGDLMGLVGQSGSGKSTLALAALGALPPGAAVLGGEVRLGGASIDLHTEAGARRIPVAYVPQEPLGALNPTVRVGRQVDWILARRWPERPPRARLTLITQALERMRITDPERVLRAYPFELSGGQLQRCLLAQALALGPQLIVADEPTTALDVTVQADVLDLLEVVARETGAGVLFVTHNIAVVWRLCPTIAVLSNGRIVEAGATRHVITSPADPYTRALLGALPALSPPRSKLPTLTEDAS